MNDTQRGMYDKYRVTDIETGEEITDFFVLKFTDKHARKALLAYADSCMKEYPHLAVDLIHAGFDFEVMAVVEDKIRGINQGDING